MRTAFIIILALFIVSTSAQRRRKKPAVVTQLPVEKVKKTPLDTIATPDKDTYVIIYSNNTWEFLRPKFADMDKMQIFKHNWDTTSIFSYRNIALDDIPPAVEIKLVSDLDGFCAPMRGVVLSKYGPRGRRGRSHNGVDIPLKVGEPILAAFDGKVRYSKYNTGGYGFMVIVRHKNGLETYYGHLSRLNVGIGDYVKAGQVIGFGGSTGRSTGPHLHFETRYMDQSFDPEHLFDFAAGELRYTNFSLEKRYFNIHSRASELLEEDDDDTPIGASEIIADANNDEAQAEKVTEKPGEKPVVKPAAGPVYHSVVSGDVLSRLAQKYGVTVDQICRLSGITRTSTLQLKQRLRIK